MSVDVIKEIVPAFVKRLGDYFIQGSNNALIVLGTDRAKSGPATVDDGLGTVEADGAGKGTGTIHIVAGRSDPKGNPDLSADSSYIYVSMKTAVDTNTNLASIQGVNDDGGPAIVQKSDALRTIFRKDMKISSVDGENYVYIDGGKLITNQTGKMSIVSPEINLGADPASHPNILGDTYRTAEDVMLTAVQAGFTVSGAAFTAVGAAFTAGAAAWAGAGGVLPVLAPSAALVAAPYAAATAACASAATACAQAASAIGSFMDQAASYLSKVVKGQ